MARTLLGPGNTRFRAAQRSSLEAKNLLGMFSPEVGKIIESPLWLFTLAKKRILDL